MNPIIKLLRKMRVGRRLATGFGVVLLLMVSLVAVALFNFSQLNRQTEQIVGNDWVKANLAGDATEQAHASMALLFQIALLTDSDELTRARIRFGIHKDNFVKALETLGGMLDDEEAKALHARTQTNRGAYVASAEKVLKLIDAGNRDDAVKLATHETFDLLNRFAQDLDELSDMQQKRLEATGAASKHVYEIVRITLLALGLLAGVFGILFSWRIGRMITSPIQRAVKVSEGVAQGDLTQKIDLNFHGGELGQLLTSLQDTVTRLSVLIQAVRDRAESVQLGASEIAQGNKELSARTESQASTLEETAAAMEEFTSTVKQNAEHANQAKSLSLGASQVAAKGGRAVSDVVHTMNGISESSKRIADIISVIDGIAFQTNILALNAAVEAARAGEQGRGFAVVAAEVRTLAQRSAAAAKEIKELIGDSVKKVDTGSKLVMDAGNTMKEVVDSVQRVTDMVGQITDASREQASGIDQVNKAVVQMDQATQQNAALVEQVSATAEAMTEQARELMDAVSAFKLGVAANVRSSARQAGAAHTTPRLERVSLKRLGRA